MATASTTKMQQQGKNLVVTDEGSRILGRFIRDCGFSSQVALDCIACYVKDIGF